MVLDIGYTKPHKPYDSCRYTALSQLVAQSQRASGDNDITLFLKVLKDSFPLICNISSRGTCFKNIPKQTVIIFMHTNKQKE